MNYLEKLSDLSNNSKYTKWYKSIVTNAISRKTVIRYYEKHHILPISFNMGGEKDTNNIINVTAREHFLLHYLLCKMGTPYSISVFFAFGKMKCDRHNKRYFNSHLYEYFRKNMAKNLSIVKKDKIAINKNNKTKFINKEKLNEYIQDGWEVGQYSSDSTTQKRITANKKRKGYIWINDGVQDKQIENDNITQYINNGWVLGRINIKKGYTIKDTTNMKSAQKKLSETSIRMINIHTGEIKYIKHENINSDWIRHNPPSNTGKMWYNDGTKEYLLNIDNAKDTLLVKGRLKPAALAL